MRLDSVGMPVIILSHRKMEFLPDCIDRFRRNPHGGITDVIVVDDSGDPEHHDWLDRQGIQFSVSDPRSRNVGYLQSMNVVWTCASRIADERGLDHVLLWEEDFWLTKPFDFRPLPEILRHAPHLAQINLQRQAVYRIERRFGYLESHQRRGYDLTRMATNGHPWIKRRTPFTTNPGLIRREVLDIDWPTRQQADEAPGGAEPAMSTVLESLGWHFGWYGDWNHPDVKHVGTAMKTGKGY